MVEYPVDDQRPLPFVVRVGANWIDKNDHSHFYEAVFYRERTRLTGDLSATSHGKDVQFSDIGLAQ
jgi:hypothetical protein